MKIKRGLSVFVLGMALALSACGSDKSASELPRLAATLAKQSGQNVARKLGVKRPSAGAKTAQPTDPNVIITKALSATNGPIALVVRIKSKAVLAMNPVGQNGDHVTWGSAPGQGVTFKRGVLSNTRGLGEDLMASRIDHAVDSITGRKTDAYRREYYYLGDLGQTTSLVVNCTLQRGKTEHVKIGEIDTNAVIMNESCKRGKIAFNNVYWVDGRGRVLKSSQWVGQRIGSLAVQNLRL